MAGRDHHCSFCGAAWPDPKAPFPRTCAPCSNITYKNPLPVAVLVLRVDNGILLVRRNFGAAKGKLAFPGGFIEVGESWQSAAARELWEEAGVRVDPATIRDLRVLSAPDGTVLIFGESSETLKSRDLTAFVPNSEASERVITDSYQDLAFPLHSQVLREVLNRP
jgi:ADP-ribose pyrophosphatase YjhB (NUDIX family)